jgi:hypothetical protein
VVFRDILLTPFNLAVPNLCGFYLLVLGERGEKKRIAGDFVVGDGCDEEF